MKERLLDATITGWVLSDRVLVIRIGRLGDTVLATPIIQALQLSHGKSVEIDFAVSPGASAYILGQDQRVNRVFPIGHRRVPWFLHAMKRELRQHSRQHPYDLTINLECGSECDDFVTFLNTKKFVGRPLIQPEHKPGRHCVDTEKTIYADLLGSEASQPARPSLKLAQSQLTPGAGFGENYIIINPGFSGVLRSGYRSHRRWPDKHWLELIDSVTGAGYQVVINGTAEEESCFESLLKRPGVRSLFGSSVMELVQATAAARCLISVDTGSMHIATALATPVIALFGPTNPDRTGPYPGLAQGRVLTSGVDCQPCFKTPQQQHCGFNRCMQELEPDQVFEAFRLMMQDTTLGYAKIATVPHLVRGRDRAAYYRQRDD